MPYNLVVADRDLVSDILGTEIFVEELLLIRRCSMSPLAVDAAVAVLVAVLDALDED